ncbi:MAG: DUF2207 family protein, partial [Acidimicrobiales bacterium]
MRTKSRRRLDIGMLGLAALVTGGATAIGGIAGDQERIPQMWVGVALTEGAPAQVVEVIDWDFGLAFDKHGIIRDIPGLTTDTPVAVRSDSAPDGIAEKSTISTGGELGIRVRIGDPNVNVSGRHRYRLDYPHPGLVRSGGQLAWDAVGTGWPVPIGEVEVHVVAPWRFTSPTCAAGGAGSDDPCTIEEVAPGHLVATVSDLSAHEGVTVTARQGDAVASIPSLPAPPTTVPADPGAGIALPAAAAGVAALGAGATTSRLVRRAGRERVRAGSATDAAWATPGGADVALVDAEELADMATTDFAPPEGISPALGGVVLAESVRDEHRVAWLIQAAVDGDLELEEEGRKRAILRRTDQRSAATAPILDAMFGGRHEVELGEYDPTFAKGWSELQSELAGWSGSHALWDPMADQRKTAVRALGGLAGLAGALAAGFGGAMVNRHGAHWLPLVVAGALLAGAGLSAAIRGWELRVRTPEGSALWLRIESFRRFLAGSEAFHAEEAAKRGVLREYTAWAVAVGEIDRWARAVDAAGSIPQEAGLGYVHVAPVLASSTRYSALSLIH